MSSVAPISSTFLPSTAINAKPIFQQTVANVQSQPATISGSSVTISSSGSTYSHYEQQIAQALGAQNQHVADAFSDPSQGASYAYGLAHDNSMTGEPVGGLLVPNAAAPAVYISGAPVTVASQAYYEKQNALYQNQVVELYNTENTKGTAPGKIVSDIYALQAKQPDAFRAMMMWPPASNPTSIQAATNTSGATQQYLNGAGQVVNS